MIDFNKKLKLYGGFSTNDPTFDDSRFSPADYRKAYDLYHISKSMGLVEWNLTDTPVVQLLQTTRTINQFHHLNYLRDHLKAHNLRLVVWKNVRNHHTRSAKFYYNAWGMLTFTRPDGTERKALLILEEARPGYFSVIDYPNDFDGNYIEVIT